jgi:hypothetical protein
VAQYALFCLALPEKTLPIPEQGWQMADYGNHEADAPDFGGFLKEADFDLVFMTGLGLTWIILGLQGTDWSGKLTYTLQRLPLSERAIALVWAGMQMLWYGILWAVELGSVLLCWNRYGMQWETAPSGLELFTQFYRNDFLHGLFPFHDISGTASVIAMILVLSVSGAYVSLSQRHKKNAWSADVVVLIALWSCRGNTFRDAATDVLVGLIWVPFLLYYIYRIGWGPYEEV